MKILLPETCRKIFHNICVHQVITLYTLNIYTVMFANYSSINLEIHIKKRHLDKGKVLSRNIGEKINICHSVSSQTI